MMICGTLLPVVTTICILRMRLQCLPGILLHFAGLNVPVRQLEFEYWCWETVIHYTAEHNMIHEMKRQSYIQPTAVCVGLWSYSDDSEVLRHTGRLDPNSECSPHCLSQWDTISMLCLTSAMLKWSHMALCTLLSALVLSFQTALSGWKA